MAATNRLSWVDMAKGLSIFLVVMYHSTLGVGDALGEPGFMHYVLAFATPFRMPEFFLISGLFLSSVISRPWPKFADRRIVHYLYFYIVWAIIQIVVKEGIGNADPGTALSYLSWAIVQPYGVLWFIYLLAVFGTVAKLLWTFRVPHAPVWIAAAILQMLPVHTASYALDQFAEYFVYFFTGYIAAPHVFRLAEEVQKSPKLAIIGLIVWACIEAALVFSPGFHLFPDHVQMGIAELPGFRLMLAIAGAIAVCVVAALLAKLPSFDPLRWLGAHSIVIYLSFVIPMAITRTVLIKFGLVTDPGILSLIVIAASVAAPVALYGLVQWTGWGKFLFERPAWAHIPGTPGSLTPPIDRANRVPAE
ncbi:MAG: acyltransferase family protein [Hyphomicrobiaceae bacterium]|nr:acyltransferase family protein [Hyphomicrobiaceae bacterium]MCC0024842.1 acyltransferase family protein [Hyphomicrobiaceae bacterium]